MGYFPNGTSNEIYWAQYCAHCRHNPIDPDEPMCAVMAAHMLKNYAECNDDDSILHMLIPRSEGGVGNEQCTMFIDRTPDRCKDTIDMFGA